MNAQLFGTSVQFFQGLGFPCRPVHCLHCIAGLDIGFRVWRSLGQHQKAAFLAGACLLAAHSSSPTDISSKVACLQQIAWA